MTLARPRLDLLQTIRPGPCVAPSRSVTLPFPSSGNGDHTRIRGRGQRFRDGEDE